ncbi:hypothetical protein KAH81_03260 [bacterium]|nr:hypothetical protein [bacterium]
MRKGFFLILAVILVLLGLGCTKTYYGSFLTAQVKIDPIDEFKAGQYIVLAFKNAKKATAEGWEYEFWAYKNREFNKSYKFQARLVAGRRNFYLVEEIPGARSETIASFQAKPNYDRIKERLTAHLIN